MSSLTLCPDWLDSIAMRRFKTRSSRVHDEMKPTRFARFQREPNSETTLIRLQFHARSCLARFKGSLSLDPPPTTSAKLLFLVFCSAFVRVTGILLARDSGARRRSSSHSFVPLKHAICSLRGATVGCATHSVRPAPHVSSAGHNAACEVHAICCECKCTLGTLPACSQLRLHIPFIIAVSTTAHHMGCSLQPQLRWPQGCDPACVDACHFRDHF